MNDLVNKYFESIEDDFTKVESIEELNELIEQIGDAQIESPHSIRDSIKKAADSFKNYNYVAPSAPETIECLIRNAKEYEDSEYDYKSLDEAIYHHEGTFSYVPFQYEMYESANNIFKEVIDKINESICKIALKNFMRGTRAYNNGKTPEERPNVVNQINVYLERIFCKDNIPECVKDWICNHIVNINKNINNEEIDYILSELDKEYALLTEKKEDVVLPASSSGDGQNADEVEVVTGQNQMNNQVIPVPNQAMPVNNNPQQIPKVANTVHVDANKFIVPKDYQRVVPAVHVTDSSTGPVYNDITGTPSVYNESDYNFKKMCAYDKEISKGESTKSLSDKVAAKIRWHSSLDMRHLYNMYYHTLSLPVFKSRLASLGINNIGVLKQITPEEAKSFGAANLNEQEEAVFITKRPKNNVMIIMNAFTGDVVDIISVVAKK